MTAAIRGAQSGDKITVLRSPTRLMAKIWSADGTIRNYDRAKHFDVRVEMVSNIRALSALLTRLERDRHACIIRGTPATEARSRVQRIGENFVDAPLHTLLIEVDNYQPLTADPVTEPAEAILEFIQCCLPDAFQGVSFHWQLSGSAGAPGKEGLLKVHLWVWLDEPRTSAVLKAWAESIDLQSDHSVFQVVQAHYTAAPVFEAGRKCPVVGRSGFVGKERDSVVLVLNEAHLAVGRPGAPRKNEDPDDFMAGHDPIHGLKTEEIEAYLTDLDPSMGRTDWIKVGMALHHETDGAGFDLWDSWSSSGVQYPCTDELQAQWDSFGRPRPDQRQITMATVKKMSNDARAKRGEPPRRFTESPTDIDQGLEEPLTALPMRTSPFRVTYFADIPEQHNKSWIIDDMLGAGEVTVWYGYPGGGKSAALGDAAAHVAAGRAWFGRPVTQGAVLYIAAERAGLVHRRLAAWRKHHGIDDIPLAVVDGAFDLCSSPAQPAELIKIGLELARRSGMRVVWIIIDTKARVMGDGDSNGDADTMRLVGNAKRLQDGLDCPHLTFIDHVPYSAPERIKGSGALAGACDGSFLIKKEAGVHKITLGSKQPNDGPDEFALSFRMISVPIGGNDIDKITTAPVVVPSDAAPNGSAESHSRSLKPAGQKVIAAFGRLIDEGKTYPAPNTPGVGPETRGVAIADLRDKALAFGIFPEPEPTSPEDRTRWRNGRNQAWKRAIDEVQTAGLLRLEGDFVWDPNSALAVTAGDRIGDER